MVRARCGRRPGGRSWFLAKRICEGTAKDLRERWDSLLSGTSVGAKVPEAVPTSPSQTAAEQLRQSLARLSAEQQSNSVFYSRPEGYSAWAPAGAPGTSRRN